MLSVVIPSRNEKYLQKTILDLLSKSTGEIEVIAILDGYWMPIEEVVNDKRVSYIHFSSARGMRNAINVGVAVSKGDVILKTDAHCMFEKGYDTVLQADLEDNWIAIPRRYSLDPEKWELIDNPKYPVDYMYLSKDLHGVIWREKNADPDLKYKVIDDVMSAQGSCWVMKKDYYHELDLLNEESYGTFFNEFQEIGLKCWLSGGRVIVNKKTWYAHWHKTSNDGRGYSLGQGLQEQALEATNKWMLTGWHKQNKPISWLVEKFAPVPTWE